VPARVTVIIATYDWSSVLPYSIGSVLGQTFRDFELLVVGDGCTDDSEQVVAAIDDPRVRWINLPKNTRHQSGPNNEGLRQAQGEIIAYLGHDDLWLPHHLEAHVRALDDAPADVAYSLCLLVAADGSYFPSLPRPSSGVFSPPSCTTHRRAVTDALGGWHAWGSAESRANLSPDVELWRRAKTAGRPFTFVPRLTGIKFPAWWRRDVYRMRPNHEQAHWFARIGAEPDLEAKLLTQLVTSESVPNGVRYADLLRHLAQQTLGRIRRRFELPSFGRKPRHVELDDIRRRKGLPT